MQSSSDRERVRPGKRSTSFSLILTLAGFYLTLSFPFSSALGPLSASLLLAMAVVLFRSRSLKSGLPEPHGKGRVAKLDPGMTYKLGLLIVVAGGASMIGVMATAFFLPPEQVFTLIFALMVGLPLSNVLYFVRVYLLERSVGMDIYSVSEEDEEGGEVVVRRFLEVEDR